MESLMYNRAAGRPSDNRNIANKLYDLFHNYTLASVVLNYFR